jgi:hypothetical protein
MSQTNVVISPGTEATVAVRVRNLGDVTETYAFIPTGISQGWATVTPPTMTLVPGADEIAQVTLRPPRSFAVPAGQTPLIIRIVPHGNPDDVATAESTITVLEYDDRRISLAQPVMRARRRQEFDVVFDNEGNSRTSCRLAIVDHTSRLSGRFDPPSLGVDPGMNETSRLRVKVRRRRWRRGRTLPFTVIASQDGHEPTQTTGTLLQEPIISGGFVGRIATLAAVGGLATVGWFHLVNPAIERAAQRAVDRSGPAAAADAEPAASTVPGEAPVPTSANSGSTPSAATQPATPLSPSSAGNGQLPGDPFDTRLVVEAPLGGQNVEQYTVPAGKTLSITDILLQNSNGDEGRIALARNAEIIYEDSLANFASFQIPLYSPFVFRAGQTVTFQVTACTKVGNSAGQSCSVAATLIGKLA